MSPSFLQLFSFIQEVQLMIEERKLKCNEWNECISIDDEWNQFRIKWNWMNAFVERALTPHVKWMQSSIETSGASEWMENQLKCNEIDGNEENEAAAYRCIPFISLVSLRSITFHCAKATIEIKWWNECGVSASHSSIYF